VRGPFLELEGWGWIVPALESRLPHTGLPAARRSCTTGQRAMSRQRLARGGRASGSGHNDCV